MCPPNSESLIYITAARWQVIAVARWQVIAGARWQVIEVDMQSTFLTALEVGIGTSGEGCGRSDLVLSDFA